MSRGWIDAALQTKKPKSEKKLDTASYTAKKMMLRAKLLKFKKFDERLIVHRHQITP